MSAVILCSGVKEGSVLSVKRALFQELPPLIGSEEVGSARVDDFNLPADLPKDKS
jgi:hypothetical protein